MHTRAHMSLLKLFHAGAYVRAHAYRHARRSRPKIPNLKHIFTHYVSFGNRSRDRQDRPAACLSPKQNWFFPVFPSFKEEYSAPAGLSKRAGKSGIDRRPSPAKRSTELPSSTGNRQSRQRKSSPTRQIPPCGITKQRKPPTGEATLSGGRKNGYYRSAGRSLSLSSPLSLRSASGLTGSVGSAG